MIEREVMKMNKHLIVIGMTLMLLLVGLCGCTDVGIGLTNIGDITANPEDYYGKEVTIEGSCISYLVMDDSGHSMEYKYDKTLSGMYRLTGIIKHGLGLHQDYFLDVTNAEAL